MVGERPNRELAAEQAYLNHAYECLDRMRSSAIDLRQESRGFGGDSFMEFDMALARRVFSLRESDRSLCFGRIDCLNGDRWYVGRRHVEDERRDPVVIEWRAPIGAPFYRASNGNPMGLSRRRRLLSEGSRLLSMSDDVFDASQEEPASGREALIWELERGRAGTMLDIVATIQPDQYEIICSPSSGVIFVQGGPGSGKTAVGLHRVAFLLYGNPKLARAQVLVLAPNRAFLRYISQVLPSLGEAAVLQITLADLVAEARPIAEEAYATERVKGDARMAAVLAKAMSSYLRQPRGPLEIGFGSRCLALAQDELIGIVRDLVKLGRPYSKSRELFRDRLVARLGGGGLRADDDAQLRRHATLRRFLDEVWPALTATKVVADLLGGGTRLGVAAKGILDVTEQQSLRRRRGRAWTAADGPLVDEARFLLAGPARTYGHVVVDEAQDLSPMQLRMLARRCPSGSMTLLGDLAQATGVWAHESWLDLAEHLPCDKGVEVKELALGYRSPAQVLELANRLLPEVAPNVRPTVAIREGHSSPTFQAATSANDIPGMVTLEAELLTARYRSVAVIVPESLANVVTEEIIAAGLPMGDALMDGLESPLTVVRARDARGLEFDAVIVVEPSEVIRDAAYGLRLLYVAITRPTQHLSIIYYKPVPLALT